MNEIKQKSEKPFNEASQKNGSIMDAINNLKKDKVIEALMSPERNETNKRSSQNDFKTKASTSNND